MTKSRRNQPLPPTEVTITWKKTLQTVPLQNQAAEVEWDPEGLLAKVTIKKRKPKYFVPPLSWMVKPRMKTTLKLDRLGTMVWRQCDGKKNLEEIIDWFAGENRLTFHESRASVSGYIQNLVRRGILAIASTSPPDRPVANLPSN